MTPNCTARSISNVTPQPLLLMNSGFAVKSAEHMAGRLRREVGDDVDLQITRAWRLTQGEDPTAADISSAKDYLQKQTQALKEGEDALATLCHALISTNRFLYVD